VAGGGSGKPWHAQKRTVGRGKRSGASGGRRVVDDPAGGGATAAVERRPEEVPKMKVVEFSKLYNIALGLKFRNPKFTTFYVKFLNKGRI
jgi:hypothetical protein